MPGEGGPYLTHVLGALLAAGQVVAVSMVVLPLDCRALLVRSDGAAADDTDGPGAGRCFLLVCHDDKADTGIGRDQSGHVRVMKRLGL
jgi:hypothetical protein